MGRNKLILLSINSLSYNFLKIWFLAISGKSWKRQINGTNILRNRGSKNQRLLRRVNQWFFHKNLEMNGYCAKFAINRYTFERDGITSLKKHSNSKKYKYQVQAVKIQNSLVDLQKLSDEISSSTMRTRKIEILVSLLIRYCNLPLTYIYIYILTEYGRHHTKASCYHWEQYIVYS